MLILEANVLASLSLIQEKNRLSRLAQRPQHRFCDFFFLSAADVCEGWLFDRIVWRKYLSMLHHDQAESGRRYQISESRPKRETGEDFGSWFPVI